MNKDHAKSPLGEFLFCLVVRAASEPAGLSEERRSQLLVFSHLLMYFPKLHLNRARRVETNTPLLLCYNLPFDLLFFFCAVQSQLKLS